MKRFLAMLLAAMLLCGMMTGCGKDKVAELEDPNTVPETPYEIQWYLMADAQNDVASVEAELNKYLKDKINATVKINCLPSGQYTQKVGTMINAGEYFDLAFVARWALDYIGNSRAGAYFDLTPHLDTYLRDTAETIGTDNLEYSYVDGSLYAIPVYKEMVVQYGWVYRQDIADKYGIDMSQYKTFRELEPVLRKIKENEPDMKYPIDWAEGASDPACLVRTANYMFSDGSYDSKAVNTYATKEYKEACLVARDFYNKGYVRPDVLTATDQNARMAEGKTFVMLTPYKPGKEQELFKDSRYDFGLVTVDEARMDYLAGTGSMQAVSASSKNPARVMRFLNMLNTDPYVKNLIIHGVEGKHYTKVSDNIIRPIEGSGYSLYANTWAIGNVFLDYLLESDDPQKNEQLMAFNKTGKGSDISKFCPKEVKDPDRKQRRMEISNAVKNYSKQLTLGAVDVEPTLKEFLEVLDKAGIEDELKDIQAEYDEFIANKK